MKKNNSIRGNLIIALAFVIVISIGVVGMATFFWNRSSVSASRLKRFQSISFAEAALYETFNRFRSNNFPFDKWDPKAWLEYQETGGASGFMPTTHLNAAGQPLVHFDTSMGITDVEINVELDDMGTADLADDRIKVLATVNQDDIRL